MSPIATGALLIAAGTAGASFGCTETPDYFPPCVSPFVDACAASDGGADSAANSMKGDALAASDANHDARR